MTETQDWDWDAEEVAELPGFGAPIAAYRCCSCGTIVPVHWGREHDEPAETIENYPCGSRWGGCDRTRRMRLVSDGFLVEYEGDTPQRRGA